MHLWSYFKQWSQGSSLSYIQLLDYILGMVQQPTGGSPLMNHCGTALLVLICLHLDLATDNNYTSVLVKILLSLYMQPNLNSKQYNMQNLSSCIYMENISVHGFWACNCCFFTHLFSNIKQLNIISQYSSQMTDQGCI